MNINYGVIFMLTLGGCRAFISFDDHEMDLRADVCGNGMVETYGEPAVTEACDDGNVISGDGCSATCFLDDQPDGQACTMHEACASGACDTEDSQTCEPADTCGNGKIETYGSPEVSETCDDGNVLAGDACSATCQIIWPAGGSCQSDEECLSNKCLLGKCFDPAEAYIKASNTGQLDLFGEAVSVHSQPDGSAILAVSANLEGSDKQGLGPGMGADTAAGLRSGAVYVFARSIDGIWTQQIYIKASDAKASSFFGDGLHVHSQMDGSATLVVGAPGADGTMTEEGMGAAYVFSRSASGTWSQQAKLTATHRTFGDAFGASVGVHSLPDGSATAVVGSYKEDSSATGVDGDGANDDAVDSGAAFVFYRAAGQDAWVQQGYLKAENTGPSDNFGLAVAVHSRDDGSATIAVGAYHEDSAGVGVDGIDESTTTVDNSGAVYIFSRKAASATWEPEVNLKATNAQKGDEFGLAVSLHSQPDGSATLAVSAPAEDSNATDIGGVQDNEDAPGSGAVYIFARDAASKWTDQAYIKASNTGIGDRFGLSLSVHSLPDGSATLAVGATGEASNEVGLNGSGDDNSAMDAGAVYLFSRVAAGQWSPRAYIKASNTGMGDHFGRSVSVHSQAGDGMILAVGAWYEDSDLMGIVEPAQNDNATDSGAAYVLSSLPTN